MRFPDSLNGFKYLKYSINLIQSCLHIVPSFNPVHTRSEDLYQPSLQVAGQWIGSEDLNLKLSAAGNGELCYAFEVFTPTPLVERAMLNGCKPRSKHDSVKLQCLAKL